MSLNDFAISLEKEEAGVWTDIGDMKFLIARAGNDEWKKLNKTLERQAYGVGRAKKERTSDKDLEILIKCLAYTCVLGWDNVTLDKEVIKYSKEKCYEILSDKRFRLLTDEILGIAMDQDRFMEDQILEDEKK